MKLKKLRRPRWTRSKTQVFGVALVILGAFQANLNIFKGWLSPEMAGWIGSGIGIAVYLLRAYTTCSLAEKEANRGDRASRQTVNKEL